MVEQVYVDEDRFSKQYWQDDIDDTQWLKLFQPFTAVKNLYTSKKSLSCIATALQDLSEERVTEVLPTLESLFLEDFRPSIGRCKASDTSRVNFDKSQVLAISIAKFLLTSP